LTVPMLSLSRFTSSVEVRSWCVPFNLSSTWFTWTFLMAYSEIKLKSSGDKGSPWFRSSWIGELSEKCLIYSYFQNIFKMMAFIYRHLICFSPKNISTHSVLVFQTIPCEDGAP
jgi:hypothetical protein